jgi:hypothetical protein
VAKVRKSAGGVRITLGDPEVAMLSQLLEGLDQILAPGVQTGPVGAADPLVALTGLGGSATSAEVLPPEDPAVRRLLPDAYEDAASAAEFRRFTSDALVESKRESLDVVRAGLATLGSAGGRLTVERDDLDSWVRTLTDLRLVLGVRLGVVEASDVDELDRAGDDDPRRGGYEVFGWLGYLLDSVLGALI